MYSRLLPGCLAIATALFLPLVSFAEELHPLDLTTGGAEWPFSNLGAKWLLPEGKQVIDGVLFQFGGPVLLYATNSLQKPRPGRIKVEHIAAGFRFDRIHLLAAGDYGGKEGMPIGQIRLQYADGSNEALTIRFGEQLRGFLCPWHGEENVVGSDAAPRPVWIAQHSTGAQSDKFFRLYHVVLTNAQPEKQVTELALESVSSQIGLFTAAISVGMATAERLQDTVHLPGKPFPDLQPRSGASLAGEGVVLNLNGEPLAGARVQLRAVRDFGKPDSSSSTEDVLIGKEAVTDSNGRFSIPDLPDNRLYRLLAVAEGFGAAWYRGMDPGSDPIEIRLKPNAAKEGKYAVHGRLLGPGDKPVSWAMVETDGVGNGTGSSWGGSGGFPQEIISNTNGEFTLSRDEPFTRVQTRINSLGMAPLMIWLDVTNKTTTIHLGPGAVVTGKLVRNQIPVGGVRIGVCGEERWSEVFAGHFETTTDTNGVFTFEHLPINISWFLYGNIASLKTYGALAPQPMRTGTHGETNDLGVLDVSQALHLGGKIKTGNGAELPSGLKIRVGSQQAWDSIEGSVAKDGSFSIEGLYKGHLEISLTHSEWHFTGENRSLDIYNPWSLNGLLEANKDDLLLVINPGLATYVSGGQGNGNLPPADRPESRPLSGAETSGAPFIILAGVVADDQTGQPIKGSTLIPGYKPPSPSGFAPPKKTLLKEVLEPFSKKTVPWNEAPFWRNFDKRTATNGNFQIAFMPLTSKPILRAEASGYEPAESEPLTVSTTNLVLRLKRGVGPNGVVLLPNGKPAPGATVLFLAEREQCSLSGKDLSNYGAPEGKRVTGADGSFAFPTRAGGQKILVSHAAGWTEESVGRDASGLKLELQPWASVSGTLVYSNGTPAAGVELAVTIPNDWQRGDPGINVQGKSITDPQGNFVFTNVPAIRINIGRIIPMSQSSWTYGPQTWLVAQSGANSLGKIIYDHPPPPPLTEQLKQKLGL